MIYWHMCGRFARSSKPDVIIREFGVRKALAEPEPNYNISPGQNIVIITDQGERQLVACRWGFIPAWTKEQSSGYKMINARAETIVEKPAFREAFLKRRCLVIADGFFEWEKGMKGQVPFYICFRSGKPFGFAGLYNVRTSPEGKDICTCTVITTGANELCSQVHDRMPAIIPKDKEVLWLDPAVRDPDILLGLLRPYPAEEMEMYLVSSSVNSPKFDSPDAIQPVV
ncbi:MAG TPA: SOS response-associated peptidase, partial [Thermodesulfovibrionales bacterium]|nr:SOS response-associated peptidase [Thermodesulfovibrionales bacterium]